MKLAILSDIHDNVWNLQAALQDLPDADALVFCGDLCSPFVVDVLAEGFGQSVYLVDGNNRGDEPAITAKASAYGQRFQRCGPYAELVEVDGRLLTRAEYESGHGDYFDRQKGGQRIAVSHFPEIGLAVAAADRYDVVCYGHNHTLQIGRVGATLTINPGTVMGYSGGKPPPERNIPATFVVYDTASGAAQAYEVVPSVGAASAAGSASSTACRFQTLSWMSERMAMRIRSS